MRTSLTEIKETEQYLQDAMNAPEARVFEARLLTSPLLRINKYFQEKAYTLLRHYHRKQLKAETEAIHQRIFSDPEKAAFRQQIALLFKK